MWNPKEKRKKSQAQIYTKQIVCLCCPRQGVGVDESAKCVKMIQTSKKKKMIQTSSN